MLSALVKTESRLVVFWETGKCYTEDLIFVAVHQLMQYPAQAELSLSFFLTLKFTFGAQCCTHSAQVGGSFECRRTGCCWYFGRSSQLPVEYFINNHKANLDQICSNDRIMLKTKLLMKHCPTSR